MEDYTLEDYRDYIEHSKQYLQIADDVQREQFLLQQMNKSARQKDFKQWQYNQMYNALGFSLHEVRLTGALYMEVSQADIDSFKPFVDISGGILKEVSCLANYILNGNSSNS